MDNVVGRRVLAACAASAVLMTGAAKCGSGGSVQVPGGPEVKVHQQEQPEMRRQCPVCSGRGRLGRVRCPRCHGFGRVRL